jgi:hypothetical protein
VIDLSLSRTLSSGLKHSYSVAKNILKTKGRAEIFSNSN